MTGAQIVIEALQREKVDTVFGYPGGQVIFLCDAFYGCPLRFILTRHEQGAAHAADGYARATGRTGVCLATSGPGATNLVTGIATAYMDAIPMVAITGQVPTNLIGNDAFQEVDITGITRPITKHNFLVKDPNDIARTIKEAFYIASSGRPGPVLIDLPSNVQKAEVKSFQYPETARIRSYKPVYEGHPLQIERALELIANAKQPLILAGGGIISSNASNELLEFIDKTKIPTAFTLMGLGSIHSNHPLNLGMIGMHGTIYGNRALIETDVLIAAGCRFDDRATGNLNEFAKHAKIVHIDIDPSSIGKNVPVDIPIVGDVKNVLVKMLSFLKKPSVSTELSVPEPAREQWLQKISQWKKDHPLTYPKKSPLLQPQLVIETLSRLADDDAIITTEVGQNQMWAAQFYTFKKARTFITSGGLGTMGFGFPAAIGAQVAFPDRMVIDIAGDGSIQMNIQELSTAVAEKIPVKVIILNNTHLGMVRQWQELFYQKRYAFTCLDGTQPDFVKLAEAYGAIGYRITDKSSLEQTLQEALQEREKPVFVECVVAPEANVFPMVPAGASLNEMIEGLA
ncbi:MAG: biosynthetic-type acetolactate synthase large subunit [Candidatus Ratteibacteria bacterium]